MTKLGTGKFRRRTFFWLLPLPDNFDEDDPVATLILSSIKMVLGAVVLVGAVSGWAVYIGTRAQAGVDVVIENGQRNACVTDLESIEGKARGDELDAILRGLSAVSGIDPYTLEQIATGEERDALLLGEAERGLEALRRREAAVGNLEQPTLDEICGRPAE